MKINSKRYVILGLFLSLLLFVNCNKNTDIKTAKILNVPLTSEISTFDPVNSYDNVSGMIIYNIYEQLYEYHYLNRPYELRPLLAEGMPAIENGGKRYVIKIKKNVQYHPHPAFRGKPRTLIATDFITAIKRLAFAPLNSTGWWIVDGTIEGINEFRKKVGNDFEKLKSTPISGVNAPDDFTLIIDLTSPSPQFIYKLAMSFISPMPMEVISFQKNDLNHVSIGTGPFYLKSGDTNTPEIVLEKFGQYHESLYPTEGDRHANSRGLLKDAGEKLPLVDQVRFILTTDNRKRWEQFLKHELDYIVLPQEFHNQTFDEFGNLKEEIKSKNIRLQTIPTLTYWWLTFNMKDKILGKNINLRKAMAHAIDMDKYIQLFTKNTGQRANSIFPPGVMGYNPSAALPNEYNLSKAQDFLAKAGYPDGKNLPEITYDTRGESKINLDQAIFFQSQLAQIGIKIKIVKNNFKTFLEKSRTGHLQFFQDGWTLDYPDAENIFQLLTSSNHPPGPNASFYTNPDIDQMYEVMSKTQDENKKKELILKMEKVINDDSVWIMQYYSRNFILHHDYLKNFRPSDLVSNYFKYLRVK